MGVFGLLVELHRAESAPAAYATTTTTITISVGNKYYRGQYSDQVNEHFNKRSTYLIGIGVLHFYMTMFPLIFCTASARARRAISASWMAPSPSHRPSIPPISHSNFTGLKGTNLGRHGNCLKAYISQTF